MKKLSKNFPKLGQILKRLNKIVNEVLKKEGEKGIVEITISDDNTLRALNKKYRKIDATTDVLSFEMKDNGILGDIIISYEMAKKNAARYKTTLFNELKRLVIHGTLHLLGYDHKSSSERKIMREKEDFYAQKVY